MAAAEKKVRIVEEKLATVERRANLKQGREDAKALEKQLNLELKIATKKGLKEVKISRSKSVVVRGKSVGDSESVGKTTRAGRKVKVTKKAKN